MNSRNFFAELKRRNVYKVAVAYAVVGWLLMQVATQIFPFLEIPNWVVRLVIALIAIGFPIALVIAWAFEATPEGIKRTETADAMPATAGRKKHAWIYIVVSCGAISATLFFLGRYTAGSKATATPNDISNKSIAVLPFDNLSSDKENAYFADGIQDEILTRLSKIADLKVISRTSTQHYKSAPENLPEIARQLGVAHILEGSVQKSGEAVRVHVQLIKAANDSHLWADTFDRKLTDIFSVETEVAKAIADQLRAKLTGQEEQVIAAKPTTNPEAYDVYLRGLASEGQRHVSLDAMDKAIGFYEHAVQLDPSFALAWSRLSRANSWLYSFHDSTVNRRDAVKRAVDVAQKLQPTSPETLLALAVYQLDVLHDNELARKTYQSAGQQLPGSSEVPAALASIAQRQGNWDEATTDFEQALVLDPRNTDRLLSAAWNYIDRRKFEAALKLLDRALDIQPNDPVLMAGKATIFQAQGNLEEAAKWLRPVNAATPSFIVFLVRLVQLRLERNLGEAIHLLQTEAPQYFSGSEIEKGALGRDLAFAQHIAGDTAGSKTTAEQARKTLEPVCKNQPDSDFAAICLSGAYALLGDKSSALREADLAIALTLTLQDVSRRPGNEENLALIRMIVGENNEAVSTLARLLQVPYDGGLYFTPITPALLRLDPTWDPLRADPTFRKLYEEKPH
jgi:TolB-like protein